MNQLSLRSALVAGAILLAPGVQAGLIDTESVGGVTPSDDQIIVNDFQSEGVVFTPGNRLSDGKSMTLRVEAAGGVRGSDTFGFVTDVRGTLVIDEGRNAAANARLGNYFMRMGDGFFEGDFDRKDPFLTMSYLVAPTSPISLEVWDLDGVQSQSSSEGVRVDAVAANGAVLASIDSGQIAVNSSQSLDGQGLTYSFFASNGVVLTDIDRLELFFTGSKLSNIGIGFDNFETGIDPNDLNNQNTLLPGDENVAKTPVPGSFVLMAAAIGLAGLGKRLSRKPARAGHRS